MAYSKKVLDHYENPRNVGTFGNDLVHFRGEKQNQSENRYFETIFMGPNQGEVVAEANPGHGR